MPKIVDDATVYHAALQTVIERGYAGATTRRMAEAAGISEVTLFRKYGSKAQLIQQAIAATADEVGFAEATRYTGDVAADLRRVVEAYQTITERRGQFLFTVLSEIQRRPELGDLLKTPLGYMATLGKLMARYQAEGVLRPEPPPHAVAALLGPLMLVSMMREVGSASLPAPDLAAYVAGFLGGRRTDAGRPN
jgi:AcrR family transcriptional regulator